MVKKVRVPMLLLASLQLAAFDAALLQQELGVDPADKEQAYERKRSLLIEGDKKALSQDDLKELLELAKDRKDLETHAEAYYRLKRLKVELATEDDGRTIVIKLREVAPQIIGIAGLAACIAGFAGYVAGSK